MAVRVDVKTSAETDALKRYQREIDKMRKELINSGKPVGEFTNEMRKLDRQQRALNKLTPQTTSRFGRLKDMFGGFVITGGDVVNAVRAIGTAMWGTVQDASALEEAQTKVAQVFDDSLPMVQEFGEGAAESIGMSERAALAATGTYGNLFRAFGIGEKQAADMSVELVKLAADLASFNDTSMDEALTALRSGLSGETEPLKRFGVALNDARLKEKALEMGIYDGIGALNASQKAQAAYEVVMADTALAQGDFARTSDGLANSLRTTEAAWEDLKAAFAEGFTSDTADGIGTLNDLMMDLKPWATAAGEGIGYVAENLYDLFYQAGASISQEPEVEKMWDTWIEGSYDAEMSFRDFEKAVEDGTVFVPELNNVVMGAHEAMKDAESAAAGLTDATDDMAAADKDATAAKDDLVRAMDGQKVAADSAAGIERTLAELTNDAAQADIAAKDALDDYNEAVKEHGEKSREAEKAKLRLEDATWRASDASADLKAKEEELSTTLEQASKDAAYEQWLKDMRDRARELADALGTVGYRSGAIAGSSGSGGRLLKHAAGGVVTSPSMSLLAENNYPEYVITTEPSFRSRSLDLYAQLGDRLGVSSNSVTIAPGAVQISVSGSSASPTSIAAEVERALQRVVRSSQLMGA